MNYQKVRLGDLPIEWKRGQGFRKSDINKDGKNRCVLYGELYTKHNNVKITNDDLSRTNTKGNVLSKKGDVLVPGTSTAAKSQMLLAREISENDIYLGGDINIIRPQSELFTEKYLPYYFQTNDAYAQLERYITGATGIIHISNKGLKELKVPILEIEEQKEIVSILDDAFASIDKAKANIARNIENAKELFLSKRENYFNSLNNEWPIKPLIDFCDKIFAGGDKPDKNIFSKEKTKELNIPVVANAVKNHGIYGYTNNPRVKKPSVSIAARGSGTGHTEFRDYPYFPIVRLIVLIPNDSINVEYLMYALKNLDIKSSGSAIPQLTVPMIKTYSIAELPIKKQIELVKYLNELEVLTNSIILNYKKELENLEELRESILQKAFIGELTNKSVAA